MCDHVLLVRTECGRKCSGWRGSLSVAGVCASHFPTSAANESPSLPSQLTQVG